MYKGILSSLKNQLKTRQRNPEYLQWRADKRRPGLQGHHILKSVKGMKKLNYLLLADIPSAFHNVITYVREATELEQIEMLVSALEQDFNYIEHLQSKIKELEDE